MPSEVGTQRGYAAQQIYYVEGQGQSRGPMDFADAVLCANGLTGTDGTCEAYPPVEQEPDCVAIFKYKDDGGAEFHVVRK